jgi:hypothetical protein
MDALKRRANRNVLIVTGKDGPGSPVHWRTVPTSPAELATA